MPASTSPSSTILLVESDVIIRFALAEYLRACGLTVIEASNGKEGRAILIAGPRIDVLICDAQLAGDDNGFALAQWVRRHRTATEVVLTSSLDQKAEAVCDFCSRNGGGDNGDAAALAARMKAMAAEHKRRTRPPAGTAAAPTRRRKRIS